MAIINKKCEKEMFEKIITGKKKFEVRINDFSISEGDTLILEEIDKGKKTGRKLSKKVGFFLKTKELNYFSQEDINKFGYLVIQMED